MNAPLPRTLLDLAGAPLPSARLSESVLLIIDAQQEYVDGALPLSGIADALAAGGKVLERARAAGTPVIHILHRGTGPFFNPDGPGYLPAAPLIPQPGEHVVDKAQANAFAGTGLAELLAACGRQQLIVIGFMTHNCVSSTVRAARERGYLCSIVAPATATRDLPDGHGGVLAAATVQAGCLAGLSDTMARIVWNTREIKD